jgi:hypothetical protein
MAAILKWLDKRKNTIVAISGVVLAWAQAKGWVDGDTAVMLTTILSIVAAGVITRKATTGTL